MIPVSRPKVALCARHQRAGGITRPFGKLSARQVCLKAASVDSASLRRPRCSRRGASGILGRHHAIAVAQPPPRPLPRRSVYRSVRAVDLRATARGCRSRRMVAPVRAGRGILRAGGVGREGLENPRARPAVEALHTIARGSTPGCSRLRDAGLEARDAARWPTSTRMSIRAEAVVERRDAVAHVPR